MPAGGNGDAGIQDGPPWAKTRTGGAASWRRGRVAVQIPCSGARAEPEDGIAPLWYQRAIVRTTRGRYNWQLEQ